jgi:RimJ/RimL family protein N-acetyltransferase
VKGPATLCTDRLVLRPFAPADALEVHRYVSDRDVAATTASIPHPYPDGGALAWIELQAQAAARGESVVFAVTVAPHGVVGAIGLRLEAPHAKAELGYWIGKPHWRRGYATEAAQAVVRFGFEELHLERIHARFMAGNRASGRVLEKLDFTREGVLRRDLFRFGEFVDCELWSLLRDEFASREKRATTPRREPAARRGALARRRTRGTAK